MKKHTYDIIYSYDDFSDDDWYSDGTVNLRTTFEGTQKECDDFISSLREQGYYNIECYDEYGY